MAIFLTFLILIRLRLRKLLEQIVFQFLIVDKYLILYKPYPLDVPFLSVPYSAPLAAAPANAFFAAPVGNGYGYSTQPPGQPLA